MSTKRALTARVLAGRVNRLPPRYRARVVERLRMLVATLDSGPETGGLQVLLTRLERALASRRTDEMWLALGVLTAALPVADGVIEAVRVSRLDGPLAALEHALAPSLPSRLVDRNPYRRVEIITGGYLVDVEETSRSIFSTGIQRVVRQTVHRWAEHDDVTLVGWQPARVGFRRLSPSEAHRATTGTELFVEPEPPFSGVETVVIPWRTTYLLPELTLQPETLHRLSALGRYSGSASGVIGYDCVPVTSAETVDFGVAGGYAGNLSAIKFFGRVAAISDAAAVEYQGWKAMLSGSGLTGPDVKAIELPVEAAIPRPEDLDRARALLGGGDLPIVLCVGSHEPRKNHLALLHAADLAWRQGAEFSLVFIGGNSWRSHAFEGRVAELTSAGRAVKALSAVPDDLLWAAYSIAHVVAFPSLNEGFGLPIAEALALGTPVLTSNFGSMAQIASQGGAILVDPRDDHSIAEGLLSALQDKAMYARLRAEAASRTQRTWDEYATETWQYLTGA